jgi:hypothetical protein
MVTLVAVSVMLTICELSTAFSSAKRNTIRARPSILGFQTSILLFLKRFSMYKMITLLNVVPYM